MSSVGRNICAGTQWIMPSQTSDATWEGAEDFIHWNQAIHKVQPHWRERISRSEHPSREVQI